MVPSLPHDPARSGWEVRGINSLRLSVAAFTMNDMKTAREEANAVEATMAVDSQQLGSTALGIIALGNKRHEQRCLWSRPSYAFLGAIPRQVPA
jgi:hypothetical protein